MNFRGRPVLGAIAGIVFGLAVAINIQQWGVRPLDNLMLFGLPLLGLVLGLVFAMLAPFRRGRRVAVPVSEPPSTPEPGPASEAAPG